MAVAAAPIHRLTVEQIFAMQEAGLMDESRRTELVDGILYDVVPPNAPHSDTVAALNRHITRALADAFEVLVQDAIFVHDGYLSPDLFVAPSEDGGQRRTRALLAIEVTHTTHRRDRQKATEYAEAEVPEYWMVDLKAREVVVQRAPVHGVYTDVSHHSGGELPIPGGGAPVDVVALLARSAS